MLVTLRWLQALHSFTALHCRTTFRPAEYTGITFSITGLETPVDRTGHAVQAGATSRGLIEERWLYARAEAYSRSQAAHCGQGLWG